METTYKEITNWMNENYEDHIDPMTNEVCLTDLSEAAGEHFGENLLDIPEIYYDIAVDVETAMLGNSFDHRY
jgi:hypothetical protein